MLVNWAAPQAVNAPSPSPPHSLSGGWLYPQGLWALHIAYLSSPPLTAALALVGTKTDLWEQREVSEEEGQAYADR